MRLYEDRAKNYESNDAGQEVAYSKGARKRENNVAETLFPEMFPRRANQETFAEEAKCFWTNSETFLLPGKQILFPQHYFPVCVLLDACTFVLKDARTSAILSTPLAKIEI